MYSFDQQQSLPLSPFAQQQQASRYPLNSFGCWTLGSSPCPPLSARFPCYPSDNNTYSSAGLPYSNIAPQIYGFPAFQSILQQQHQLPLGPSTASPFYKDHQHVLRDLFNDRQRDLALDHSIKKLVDSARFSRRSDHTVRHIMQGRPIEKREIVRDILADRIKDQAISELVSFVLEDRKYNRSLDQVLFHFQAGVPIPVGSGEDLVKQERQRIFDSQVAQGVQAVLLDDIASQFGGIGLGGTEAKPWGFPTDPISSTAVYPGDQRQFANASAQCPFPTAAQQFCPPATQFMPGCSVSAPQAAMTGCIGPLPFGNMNNTTCNPVDFQACAAAAMMGPQQLYGGCSMEPDLAGRSMNISDIAAKKFM